MIGAFGICAAAAFFASPAFKESTNWLIGAMASSARTAPLAKTPHTVTASAIVFIAVSPFAKDEAALSSGFAILHLKVLDEQSYRPAHTHPCRRRAVHPAHRPRGQNSRKPVPNPDDGESRARRVCRYRRE